MEVESWKSKSFHPKSFHPKSDNWSLITVIRDWPESNRRPSASDWREFPHSLDYSFTIGIAPVGGGRYVVGILIVWLYSIYLFIPWIVSYNQSLHLLYWGSRAWLKITVSTLDLGFLEFDHIH